MKCIYANVSDDEHRRLKIEAERRMESVANMIRAALSAHSGVVLECLEVRRGPRRLAAPQGTTEDRKP